MIRVNGCIMIISQEDFNEYWNEGWQRFDHAIMKEKPTEYPAFYRYNPSWDNRGCGDWVRIDKTEFKLAVEKRIEEHKENLRFLEKILDKIN